MNPTEEENYIFFPNNNLRISLELSGIISFIPCRTPTEDDLNWNDGVLEFIRNVDNWDPHDTRFETQESAMTDFSGNVKQDHPTNFIVISVSHYSMDSDLFCNDLLDRFEIGRAKFLNEEVNMYPRELAKAWNINENMARRTICAITWLCKRNTKDITLSRRYPYNDRMVCYKHLTVPMFTDTMHASGRVGKSLWNYEYAQVFATSFKWVGVVILEFERDIPSAYKQIFEEVGIPKK